MNAIATSGDSREQLDSLWHNPYYDRRKSLGVVNRRHLGLGGRRGNEEATPVAPNSYVDVYPSSLAIKAFLLVTLSTLDAVFTQILLAAGAHELNGFVAYIIGSNSALFVPIKVGVTGLAAVFLVVHHNFIVFQVLRVRTVLRFMVAVYAALIVYELWLLAFYI